VPGSTRKGLYSPHHIFQEYAGGKGGIVKNQNVPREEEEEEEEEERRDDSGSVLKLGLDGWG
jgi:hypothetical protein